MHARKFITASRSSAAGNRWRLKPDGAAAPSEYAALGLHPSATGILASRGISPQAAEAFLNPTRENSMPPAPYDRLKRMGKAVDRICAALQNDEKIAVLGDYDVDGCTGTAILERFFKAVGVDVVTYIPHRVREGYGPNVGAIRALHEQGVKLLLTVDCGTTAYEPLEEAARLKMGVIVTDHHKTDEGPKFPANTMVVNPNRPDDGSRLKYLTGAGVAYLLCEELFARLEKPQKNAKPWFEPESRPMPDRAALFETLRVLAALGTHCDVAPIEGVNRWLLKDALKTVNRWRREKDTGRIAEWPIPGLRTLAEVSGLAGREIDEDDFGFQIGPRINAGGRVAEVSDLGKKLLATDNPAEALRLARELDHYNTIRKDIQKAILKDALRQAEQQAAQSVILVAREDWHEGVIGIVAGQLKETFRKPVFVVTIDKQGHAKGSARSIDGVDIGDAVITAVREKGLLTKGGGHTMAAGFSLEAEGLSAFHDYLNRTLAAEVEKATDGRHIRVDDILRVCDLTPHLVESYKALGPFGRRHEPPRIVVRDLYIVEPSRLIGRDHNTLLMNIRDAANSSERATAIAYKKANLPVGAMLRHPEQNETALRHPRIKGALPRQLREMMQLAGRVVLEHFKGESRVQLQVEDCHLGPLRDILDVSRHAASRRTASDRQGAAR